MDIQSNELEFFPVKSAAMRTATLESISNDAVFSSLAYANLAVFLSILFCFAGMAPSVAMFYVLFSFLILFATAALCRYSQSRMDSRGAQVSILVSVVLNDLVLPTVLVFDFFAQERANTMAGIISVASVSFISIHLCARSSRVMIVAKFTTIMMCGYFTFQHNEKNLPVTEINSLLSIAFFILMATGYWIIVRRRQELQWQFRLERLNTYSQEQNRKLSAALLENTETNKKLNAEFTLRKKLLSHIGHDLRQPISAAVYMLMEIEKSEKDESRSTLINDTRACVNSASRMIEDIVQATHYDNAEIDNQPELLYLNDLLNMVFREHVGLAAEAQCQLSLVETGVSVFVDPELLGRILRNLVRNAIKHSDATKIVMGVRRRKGEFEIWVADNGCGLSGSRGKMDEEGMNTSAAGLGLGLKISYQLAAVTGAKLKLNSREGEGTVARLIVPR